MWHLLSYLGVGTVLEDRCWPELLPDRDSFFGNGLPLHDLPVGQQLVFIVNHENDGVEGELD